MGRNKNAESKNLVSGYSDPALFILGQSHYLLLAILFHFGTVIYTDKSELAISYFKWIASLASSNKSII